ncbi:AAEL010976-PA [Aedes aegypti]|uniref:AAEL010976-PA n=1 Tax=Aedes aegypti TaxID=7159 RepID=Q16RF1_AEDAE|nr:AAEL010976-PA [Aedes aegypti]
MMAEGQEQKPGTSGTPGVIKMSMPMFGHMEPFVVGEKFVEYVSRLEQFFLVNEVPDNKKVPMLVTMAGPSLYSIASRICGEIAESCEYNAFLQEALRDQFVAGVYNSNLRTKLLTEANLTFERACEIARSWEAAEQESKAMQVSSKIAALNRRPGQKSFKSEKSKFVVQEKKKQASSPAKKSPETSKSCFRCVQTVTTL